MNQEFSHQAPATARQVWPSRWCLPRHLLCMLLLTLAVGCQAQQDDVGVGITGVDHLADHLSVQEFSVNGSPAGRAGGGGGTVCCAMLPRVWRPGLVAKINWVEQNWRDCSYRDRVRIVPVEKYESPGHLWVHFLKDGNVRVISSDPGPRNPAYPGPHDEIPIKNPWHEYPADAHCHQQWTEEKDP